jgi:hypothetical protein
MTIVLTQNMRIAGVEQPPTTKISLDLAAEADLVQRGAAIRVAPNGRAIPVSRRESVPPPSRVVKRGANLSRVFTANSGTASTITIDAASPFGRPAIRVAIPSGNTWTEVGFHELNVPAFNGHVAYRVWLEDYTAISDLRVFVGNAAYALNSFQQEFIAASNAFLMNGERVLYAGPTRVNAGGSFVFGSTPLQNTKLRITPVSARTSSVWIDAIEIPEPAPAMFALTFDDASRSWMTLLLPLLRRYGIKATFNVNTGDLGGNPALFVGAADLQLLAREGHQITAHNVGNLKYTAPPYAGDQTATQYMTDYTTARRALEVLGLSASDFLFHSYVQGGTDGALMTEMESDGVRCARLASLPRLIHYGSGLGREIMALPTFELGTSYAPSVVTQGVDSLAEYGGLMIVMGHEVISSGTPVGVQVLASDLEAVLKRVRDYGIDSVTMREAYERLYLAQSITRPVSAP